MCRDASELSNIKEARHTPAVMGAIPALTGPRPLNYTSLAGADPTARSCGTGFRDESGEGSVGGRCSIPHSSLIT
jgi:hypothetical protein